MIAYTHLHKAVCCDMYYCIINNIILAIFEFFVVHFFKQTYIKKKLVDNDSRLTACRSINIKSEKKKIPTLDYVINFTHAS